MTLKDPLHEAFSARFSAPAHRQQNCIHTCTNSSTHPTPTGETRHIQLSVSDLNQSLSHSLELQVESTFTRSYRPRESLAYGAPHPHADDSPIAPPAAHGQHRLPHFLTHLGRLICFRWDPPRMSSRACTPKVALPTQHEPTQHAHLIWAPVIARALSHMHHLPYCLGLESILEELQVYPRIINFSLSPSFG